MSEQAPQPAISPEAKRAASDQFTGVAFATILVPAGNLTDCVVGTSPSSPYVAAARRPGTGGGELAVVSWQANPPAAPKPQKVRLSRVVVDSTQLARYKALLKEEIEASIRKEPGVLTLYAVFEKKRPNHLTILEMYADEASYQAHIKTPHFLKYKQGTLGMVTALELIDTNSLIHPLF